MDISEEGGYHWYPYCEENYFLLNFSDFRTACFYTEELHVHAHDLIVYCHGTGVLSFVDHPFIHLLNRGLTQTQYVLK